MPSTKRKEASLATRAKILEVARDQFQRFGFERTDLRSVALRAGYSTGAIFSSFKSKGALFEACMGEQAPDALSFLDRIIEADAGPVASDERSVALYELAKAAKVLKTHLVGIPE